MLKFLTAGWCWKCFSSKTIPFPATDVWFYWLSFYSTFLRSCWPLLNCFSRNKTSIQCPITAGSSSLPAFCMDPACPTWRLTPVSLFFSLLPKIAHPVTFPASVNYAKRRERTLLVSDCTSSFLSYLCRTFALFFPLGNSFHNLWALVYSWPSAKKMLWLCLELWKLFSAPLIAKVLLSGWKGVINWHGETHVVLTAAYNWITFLTVISDWLQ